MKKFIITAWALFTLVLTLRLLGVVSNTWLVIGMLLFIIAYSTLLNLYPKAQGIIHGSFVFANVVMVYLMVAPRFPFTVNMLDTVLTDRDLANGAKISRFSELRQDLMAKLGGFEGRLTAQETEEVNSAKKRFEQGKISEDDLLAVYTQAAERAAARSEKIQKVALLLGTLESSSSSSAQKPLTVTYVTSGSGRRDVVSFPTPPKERRVE